MSSTHKTSIANENLILPQNTTMFKFNLNKILLLFFGNWRKYRVITYNFKQPTSSTSLIIPTR